MTTEEAEQPAKQYQIEAVKVQLKSVDSKLDQLLEGQKDYVTHAQLAENKEQLTKYTDNKVSVLEAQYGPIRKLFWVFITAIVIEGALIAFQFKRG